MKGNNKQKEFLYQAIKFGIVGVFNTLLTLLIIWICLRLFHWSDNVSNVVGYAFGVINSFIWNKKWTFSYKGKLSTSFIKFVIVFLVSYLIQFCVLQILLKYLNTDSYYCHLLSMVVYTLINFVLNKIFTFKNNTK